MSSTRLRQIYQPWIWRIHYFKIFPQSAMFHINLKSMARELERKQLLFRFFFSVIPHDFTHLFKCSCVCTYLACQRRIFWSLPSSHLGLCILYKKNSNLKSYRNWSIWRLNVWHTVIFKVTHSCSIPVFHSSRIVITFSCFIFTSLTAGEIRDIKRKSAVFTCIVCPFIKRPLLLWKRKIEND